MRSLVAVVAAYLFGSIPFSYLVVRAQTRLDIRNAGSGNLGATNVLRVAGKFAALIVLVGDVGKGVAAVLLAQRLSGLPATAPAAALAAVLGHIWPIFLRSGGGKGGATGLGALFALAPAASVMCVPVLAIVIAWTRYVSLGTIVTALAAPALVVLGQRLGWVQDDGPWSPLAMAGIAVIILIKHRTNVQRLRTGQEPKLGDRWKARMDPNRSTSIS